jgi:hypothetical protein
MNFQQKLSAYTLGFFAATLSPNKRRIKDLNKDYQIIFPTPSSPQSFSTNLQHYVH